MVDELEDVIRYETPSFRAYLARHVNLGPLQIGFSADGCCWLFMCLPGFRSKDPFWETLLRDAKLFPEFQSHKAGCFSLEGQGLGISGIGLAFGPERLGG